MCYKKNNGKGVCQSFQPGFETTSYHTQLTQWLVLQSFKPWNLNTNATLPFLAGAPASYLSALTDLVSEGPTNHLPQ